MAFTPHITGKAFVLGENIDTDQIIPAKHLVYSMEKPEERREYARFALSGVPLEKSGLPQGGTPFVPEGSYQTPFPVLIGGPNFGCGSSREHAPFALAEAGAAVVIAPSYARIFYRNAIDGGFITPAESQEDLSKIIQTGDEVEVDLDACTLKEVKNGKVHTLLSLGDVADILKAGSVFAYARTMGLMPTA